MSNYSGLYLLREKYEALLGHFLASHQVSLNLCKAMAQKSLKYMNLRVKYFAKTPIQEVNEFTWLYKIIAKPVDYPFSGRIHNQEEFYNIFKGNGNIRELIANTWLFINNVFAVDLVGKKRISAVYELAEKSGFNMPEIEKMTAKALAYKSEQRNKKATIDDLDPKLDFVKMYWHEIRKIQVKSRIPHEYNKTNEIWSRTLKTEFEAEGGEFSPIEKRLNSKRGKEYVPWLDARFMWLPNSESQFVKAAWEKDIPLMTGLSGVTMQLFQIAYLLDIFEHEAIKTACLGYLLSTKAHSFHEIMMAAQYFNCRYDKWIDYLDIKTISENEIVTNCGYPP